jgi:hypothetical protein
MSITGSMQLVGKVEELERRVAALEAGNTDLSTKLGELAQELAGVRMRAGRQRDAG